MQPDPIAFWQHVHGACAHFPIAMIIVSFLFDMAAFASRRHAASWRTVAYYTLIIGAVVAVPLILSGLTGQLGWFGVEKWDAPRLLLHRNLALASGGVTILLAIWRVARHDAFKPGEFAIYLVLLTAATVGIGYTGWLGAYVAQGA